MKYSGRYFRMRLALALGLLLGLGACHSGGGVTAVAIAPGILLSLPSPAELGREVEAVQMVTADYGSKSFAFEVRLSVDSERVLLVGTDTMGRRAMNIEWERGTLSVDHAPWLPDVVRPENVLADLVLLYWPDEAVRKAVTGTGAHLVTGMDGREIRRGDTPVVKIRYQEGGKSWTGATRLNNVAWDYRLDVHSVEVLP